MPPPPPPHTLGGRAAVIGVFNYKGGVGKTTSVVHIASILARKHNRRVLVVDLDHQANATLYYLGMSYAGRVETSIESVIWDGAPIDKIVVSTPTPGLELIPASFALSTLDVKLATMFRKEDKVAQALMPLANQYDFIILDTPPSLSLTVVSALAASDYLITPIDAGIFALLGLQRFLEQIEVFRAERVLTATHLGVLVTKADRRTKVWKDIVQAVGERWPIFDAIVLNRAGWEAAVAGRANTPEADADVDPAPDITEAYERAVEELLDRLGTFGEPAGRVPAAPIGPVSDGR
jgi:chromosome partitioning protein